MIRTTRYFVAIALALGVAAPALTARAEDWVKKEESSRPFIGVYPVDMDQTRQEALDYKGEGVLIEDVVGGGPAEKAGIKAGDIVFKIDKEKIDSEKDFRAYIRDHEVGETVHVFLIRDKKEIEIPVELGKRKEDSFTINVPSIEWTGRAKKTRGFLGVESMTLDDQLAEYFGVKEGALVQKVVSESPADKAGVKAGDVIVKFDDANVSGSEGLREAIRSHKPEEKVDVKLMRKGQEQVIPVTLASIPGISLENMSEGKSRRIIIKDGEDINIDWEEIQESLQEAIDEIDEDLRDGREDLRHEMENLKQEMHNLRQELKDVQKKREQEEKKTEPKKP